MTLFVRLSVWSRVVQKTNFCAVVHVVGRVCDYEVEFVPGHENFRIVQRRGIAAHQAVAAQLPNVAPACDRGFDFFLGCIRVEVVIMGFFRHIQLLDQIFEVILMEAGHGEVVAVEVKIGQEVFQNLKIPLAGDLVQGHVDHLFLGLVPDVQNDDLGFFDVHVHHHGTPLVAFDDGAIVIYDDGVSVAQPLNAGLYVLIFRVLRGQGFSGVVGGGNEVGQSPSLHPHGVGLLHGVHLLCGV